MALDALGWDPGQVHQWTRQGHVRFGKRGYLSSKTQAKNQRESSNYYLNSRGGKQDLVFPAGDSWGHESRRDPTLDDF